MVGITQLAQRTALVLAAAATLAPAQAVAQQQGIKVHGAWVIEVRNADGTLASRNEFKNALEEGGEQMLADLLGRSKTVELWMIQVEVQGVEAFEIHEPNQENPPSPIRHKNLTVTVGLRTVVLQGSFVSFGTGDATVVRTRMVRATESLPFTSTSITPIRVESGQTVSVTVTFSFS